MIVFSDHTVHNSIFPGGGKGSHREKGVLRDGVEVMLAGNSGLSFGFLVLLIRELRNHLRMELKGNFINV